MSQKSAGLLLYRLQKGEIEVFLVHPGGPFWAKKDEGAWSIPKGLIEEGEDDLKAAKREFEEETGQKISGNFIKLEPLKQPGGKIIWAWAVTGDIASRDVCSNNFTLEWPPKSGKFKEFPEIDRGEWFDLSQAKTRILKGQLGFLEQLHRYLHAD